MRLHAFLTTPFSEKTKYTKRKSVHFCARRYSDVIVGVESPQMTTCTGRGRGWSAVRAQRGSARRVQCRAGQGREGLAHLSERRSRYPARRTKMLSTQGVWCSKSTIQPAAFPPATVKHACAQQVATFIARQRAHAPTRPEPPQTPAHILKDENVYISKAAGLASVGKVQRRRYLPHEGRCEGLRTQSRVVMQAWGMICVGLNRPVGPRFSRAMAVEGDG